MGDRKHSAFDLSAIAEEVYLYLFPLVLMDVTRRVSCNLPAGARPGFGPMNQFSHMRAFPPGDFKEVVRPNFDTLYSIAWLDLRSEPAIVSVPDTGGRYYMLPMLDMWTDVFNVVGSRTTGTGEGHYAITGPGWDGKLPAGVERIEAPTDFVWIIGRTQTNGVSDYEAVHEIQDGFVVTPMSRWPETPLPAEDLIDSELNMKTPPLDQVLSMDGVEYLSYAAELMVLHRPHLVDQPTLARMSRIGLHPGEPFQADQLSAEAGSAIKEAPTAAQRLMEWLEPRLSPVVNGWGIATFGMGAYGTEYARRAVVAKIGLGANLVDDAIYPVLFFDENEEVPDGANDYVLHFDRETLPPADAFWSVTMYDGEGFPVPNEIERYALGDRDPLVYNEDGSLDLYIQSQDPGGARSQNWLPAPEGPLGVTLRLYSPRPEVKRGEWAPPLLKRV
jgi:hypothetical protein